MKLQAQLTVLVAVLAVIAVSQAHGAETAAPKDCRPERGCGASALDGEEPRVRARIVLHPDDLRRTDAQRIGLWLEMDPGWHIYAENPGDTGLPTQVTFHAADARVRPQPWPPHSEFLEGDGMFRTFGYEGGVLIPAEMDGRVEFSTPISARAEFLACNGECIPGSVQVSLSRRGASALDGAYHDWVRSIYKEDGDAGTAAQPGFSWLYLVALAFLGGLILNAMPCVLPVLAIKVFSVTEIAHQSRGAARRHGVAYAAGVLLSMWVLAFVVLALRASGSAVGWGFQLQEPRYIAGICALLLMFALNLFGIFEFATPGGRWTHLGARVSGPGRSFFEGLLAVALATPCSAPFLGTAVGFGLTQSEPTIFAVFGAVGAGLAAPFTLICLVPAWSRVLPRPGPWMADLRILLGFGLLGAVVWLLWVLGRVANGTTVVFVLGLLWALAVGAWLHGRSRSGIRGGLTAAVAMGVVLAGIHVIEPASTRTQLRQGYGAAYSRQALEAALGRGETVFAYFTADWCITCKVNERRVLAQSRVRDELARRQVVVLRADWTQRDETIRRELARHGRAGVPLYVVFRPGEPPVLLSEWLTEEQLFAAVGDPQHRIENPSTSASRSGSDTRDGLHAATGLQDR